MTPPTPQQLTQQRMEARSRAMAQAVVSAIGGKLLEEAKKHGGYLPQTRIQELTAELEGKAELLTKVFSQALTEAALEQEELHWQSMKRPPFERLLVKRFEHLLIREDTPGHVTGTVSRRMLPGYFLALNMMVGPEKMEDFHKRCEAAVQRVMKGRLPVDWDLLERDAVVHDMILDTEYAFTLHFSDAMRRSEWFLQIINTHLAPIGDPSDPDADWVLDRRILRGLIGGILKDIKATVHDEARWKRFQQRHPDANRHQVSFILDRLE
ncbi:MAG: hypothetical protein HQL36_10145 [Alphaproteobacteria bacterium]|nr:hypothetical protein [Alphaproteobacteria bacterium]MBF0251528.1 hypothetical protein [Alphaproteobacteria bacterium]